MTKQLILASLLSLSVTACVDSSDSEPRQHLPTTETPTFKLTVTNHSVERGLVDIQVIIDEKLAISGDFDVTEAQGYTFSFALANGAHGIHVKSADSTVSLDATVAAGANAAGKLDYYGGTIESPERFLLTTTGDPHF